MLEKLSSTRKDVLVEKQGNYKGYNYVVLLLKDPGYRCGYVEVSDEYNSFIKSLKNSIKTRVEKEFMYDNVAINCHGGVTYSGYGVPGTNSDKKRYFIGFDCAHAGDGIMKPHNDLFGDFPVRSLKYVEDECISIIDQIIRNSKIFDY